MSKGPSGSPFDRPTAPSFSEPSVSPIRLPLVLPPPRYSTMPRTRTTDARDAVRADFVACYDSILEDKDVLLTSDDTSEKKEATGRLLGALVRTHRSFHSCCNSDRRLISPLWTRSWSVCTTFPPAAGTSMISRTCRTGLRLFASWNPLNHFVRSGWS
jgi:hypothetical protein